MLESWFRTKVAELCCMEESQVKDESTFLDDLGFDSLDIVELTMTVEEEYDIEISEEDMVKHNTFKEAVDYLNARLSPMSSDASNS